MPYAVMAICGGAIAFDGYDLVVYGATLSSLREEWNLDPATAGLLGSVPLIGMLLGAMLVGSAAARFGRRTMFLATVAFFSALMAITAAASGPELFALLRFFAGLGLGGVMPLAAALTTEFAPPGRRNLSYVIMQSGYPVGGVVASVLAMALLPVTDWRIMYLLGALPLILILPFAWRLLPESEEYLDARRGGSAAVATRKDRSGDGPASGVRTASEDSESTPSDARSTGRSPVLAGIAALFAPGYKSATVLFWTMSFCSLLFVYGINTWLPTLMLDAGYALSSSLRFLLAFNAGAIVGGIAGGWAADRWTPKRVVVVSFVLGAAAVLGFTSVPAEALLLVLAAIAGYGAVGTQTLINGWVTRSYPPHARTTGIGWSLGVGRLGGITGPTVTGLIVAATGAGAGAFWLFAAVGVIGAALASGVRVKQN
ncbi:MAG: MFS transporter [Brachybacterium sp.]